MGCRFANGAIRVVGLLLALSLGPSWTNTADGQDLPAIDGLQKTESASLAEDLKAAANADADDDEEKIEFIDEIAKRAFGPPPQAKRISKQSNLWVDTLRKRVYVDGYVAVDRGQLEMFGCPSGTKEHESVVGLLAKSDEVHAALLAVGAKTGTTAAWEPEFVPATGQRIRLWVCWLDNDGEFKTADARTLIRNIKTKQSLQQDWVFAGSSEWRDPDDGKVYYQANGGDMICVSNFGTAMLDLPIASSAEANNLLFEPNANTVPKRDTPIRLMMIPVPDPTDADGDEPAKSIADKPPTRRILPPAEAGKGSESTPVSGKSQDAGDKDNESSDEAALAPSP